MGKNYVQSSNWIIFPGWKYKQMLPTNSNWKTDEYQNVGFWQKNAKFLFRFILFLLFHYLGFLFFDYLWLLFLHLLLHHWFDFFCWCRSARCGGGRRGTCCSGSWCWRRIGRSIRWFLAARGFLFIKKMPGEQFKKSLLYYFRSSISLVGSFC